MLDQIAECIPPAERWMSLGAKLGVAGLIVLVGTLLVRRGLDALTPIIARRGHDWGDAFVDAAPRPLNTLVWFQAACYAADALSRFINFSDALEFIDMVQHIGTIVILTWLVIRWKQRVEKHLKKRLKARAKDGMQKATVDSLSRFLTVVIYVISGMMILPYLTHSTTTLLAWGSAGVFGVTLAGQTIIHNLFGGLMIQITRPFGVGDWISSPDKEIEGTVQDIGWYMTRISSFEKRPIYVPNSLFTSMVLVNPSRMGARRIKTDIGIRYDDFKKLPGIVEAVEDYLKGNPEINQELSLMVHFTQYGAYSLNFNIYCFTVTTNWAEWRRIMGEVLHRVGQIIVEHGAQIAFPTNVMKLEQEERKRFPPEAE